MYQLLKEIADVGAGQGAPQDGRAFGKIGMPFIRAGNLVELLMGKDIEEIQKIAEDTARKYKLKVYPKGTVLFAKSGMSCLKGYVYVLPCNAYVVNHLACIVPREDFSLYLRYYFNYHKPNQLVKDEAYPSISLSDIGNLKIDVKSKEQREHIVKILNTIKDIITIRKKEIEILDTLVNARFVEMFGDVAFGKYKYDTCKLGDVAKIGSSHRVFAFEFVNKGVPFYRGTEIGELAAGQNPKVQYYISEEHYNKISDDETKPNIGDLLMPSICNKGQIWRVNTDKPFYYKDGRVLCISPDRKIFDTVYLEYFMKIKTVAEYSKIGSGSTFAEFKIFLLKEIEVSVPPLSLQNQFADFVNQVDKSKVIWRTFSFKRNAEWRERQQFA